MGFMWFSSDHISKCDLIGYLVAIQVVINTLSDQGPSPETGDAEMYDVQATNEFTEKGEINR